MSMGTRNLRSLFFKLLTCAQHEKLDFGSIPIYNCNGNGRCSVFSLGIVPERQLR